MIYSKLILILIVLHCNSIANAQGYFYSIGGKREFVSVPDPVANEVDEQLIDTTGTLPFGQESPKIVWAVSMPLDKLYVTSPFGTRCDPLKKCLRRMHSGIDLRARFEPVRAMLPGTVIDCGYSKAGGYYVSISHGACICSYLHL